ncbi:uncharacterized protein LOC134335218 [Trichomycterus rosablanca]|uniref:uncharacterized protein LOC134335218 n=1 Tax=Trichomycterus rosablanca TaxID=2290929 RepID=UPI002F350998
MVEDLRLCSVKPCEETRRCCCFQIITPTKSVTLQADSEETRQGWISAIQSSIITAFNSTSGQEVKSVLTTGPSQKDESPVQKIRAIEGNDTCCECGRPEPEWASVNLGENIDGDQIPPLLWDDVESYIRAKYIQQRFIRKEPDQEPQLLSKEAQEPRLLAAEPRLLAVEPRLLAVEPRLLAEEPRLLAVEPRLLAEELQKMAKMLEKELQLMAEILQLLNIKCF